MSWWMWVGVYLGVAHLVAILVWRMGWKPISMECKDVLDYAIIAAFWPVILVCLPFVALAKITDIKVPTYHEWEERRLKRGGPAEMVPARKEYREACREKGFPWPK